MAAHFKIDPEFQALIAPLKPEEREQLETNLVANGCRDSLVVWNGILIDGHNRYEICNRRNIKFRTVEMALASRDRVLLWIEENQLGRRNLTDDQRATIADSILERQVLLEKAERAKKAGKAGPRIGRKADSLPATPTNKLSPLNSRKTVAKAAKVSERKLRAIRDIKKKRGKKALVAIRMGEKTVTQVKTEIRREERMARVAEMAAPPPLPADQKFPILYADPPWKYEYAESDSRVIENQYPTMDLAAICALPVGELATEHAVLFLWATSPKLEDAFTLLKAWGFQYRTNLVWVKDRIGMGYYVRQQHELLLIAKRGELPMPEVAARPSSVLNAPRGKHSEKPEEAYRLIETMYPTLPRIELFARAERAGWTTWGNQTNAGTAKTAS